MSFYAGTSQTIPFIATSRWGRLSHVVQIFQNPVTFLERAQHTYGDVFQLSSRPYRSLFAPIAHPTRTIFVFGEGNIHQLMRDTDTFHQVPLVGKLLPQRPTNCPYHNALRRLGKGLLSLNAEAHINARQLMMPAFHRQQVDRYAPEMTKIINRKFDQWANGAVIDAKAEVTQLVLYTAGRILLGVDFRGRYAQLGQLLQQWLHLMSNPLLFMLPFNLTGTPYNRFLKLSLQLNEAFTQLIQQRRNRPSSEWPNNVLSTLLQATKDNRKGFSDEEIVGHLNTLFAAGIESTCNAIIWVLLLLNQHPRVTQNLYEEIDKVLQGAIPLADDLDRLPYLDMVIKEGLRLAPSLMSLRMTSQKTQIGQYEIGRGSEIVFSHFHTHRNPAIYENPYTFVPERWLSINPSPYDYIPYTRGRRMCIGVPYAQMQIKLFIAMLLQRFRFQLPSKLHLDPVFNVTIGFKQKISLALYPQDGLFWRSKSELSGGITELVHFNC